MANTRRINHPCYSRGLFDIVSRGAPLIGKNQTYGQFPFVTTIGIRDKTTGAELNPTAMVCGYGSLATTLNPDNVYSLSGRFIAPNVAEPPMFHFDQEVTQLIGKSDDYTTSLANKTSVWGIGIIIERHEFPGTRQSEPARNLRLTVRHTDYNNISKTNVTFNMDYVVPGNPLLLRLFPTLTMGLEITLSGFICHYNIDTFVWEAHVLGISFHSGNEDPTAASASATPSQQRSRRPGMFAIGSATTTPRSATTSTPSSQRGSISMLAANSPAHSPGAASGSLSAHSPGVASGSLPPIAFSGPSRPQPPNPAGDSGEEGEISQDDHVQTNTYPPKRTLSNITKDAQKELKRMKR